MTLEQIRILAAVVECGSLKKAAEQLHKTQPALSMAMQKLEAELGFLLLDRQHYRLSLTPHGAIFFAKLAHC
ncbi:LysR family transcriptional regulator [Pseudoalteromonas tunicata]|uniref:LysR family transcriptional regulator n=1 Tax=Pseudoalteromonas tunicata TaxID=314281 RepID=UPI00273D0C05|nr:LysR family transcriptional regulator [Pseudoalteromonas tunicata]MDP5214175.1 LysR family transcriptional regulator [Pseudoalteromonas tunicata]